MNKTFLITKVLLILISVLTLISVGVFFFRNNYTDLSSTIKSEIEKDETEESKVEKGPAAEYQEIKELLENDLASTEKRTLEITGWKKLSDEMRLDFISEQMEIWIPEEWFSNGGVGSGRGVFVLLYQWPEGVEKTEENRKLLQGYYPESDVLKVEFLNLGSRVLSLNEDYLRNYTPYISYEDTISEVIISGVEAKKVTRLFLKTDRTEVTQYSLVFENLSQGFKFVDISISDETYTNAEEILDEIIKRIEIKE